MAFKIERALTGMLDSFKLFSQGATPRDLSEQVVPTIDLNTYAQRSQGIQCFSVPLSTVSITGSGFSVNRTTTSDLYVVGATIQLLSLIGGGSASTELIINAPGQQSFCLAATNNTQVANTGQQFNALPIIYQGFWMPRGTLVSLYCSWTSLANSVSMLGTILHYDPALN